MSENQQFSWPGWETVRLIGRGSFGAVYEIQRDVFGEIEKAALKVISIPQNESDIEEMYNDGYDDESITSTVQSHLRSIVAEYSLMRKMNGHTNIVSCDDMRHIQHDDGIGWDIFIKMELLTPLAKALPADIEEQETIRVAKDICAALELCSKHNVIHRDIKPQNIFVSEHGDYKLGDFGIAKTVEKTMGGTKIGTYKYMAPEVYNNQPYGHSSDIYSLGLVLYWLLNERRMPFLPLPPAKLKAGMEEEARERRFRGEELPAPAHGSKALQAIVLKACAYDPAQRYHTAAEMLQDLEKLGAKPAMPELVTAAALAPKAAPEVAPAPVQKPAPELDVAVKLSPAAESYRQHYQQHYEKPQAPAQKTREQIAEEYRRNYQAQQEKQERMRQVQNAEMAESDEAGGQSKWKKVWVWIPWLCYGVVWLTLIPLLRKCTPHWQSKLILEVALSGIVPCMSLLCVTKKKIKHQPLMAGICTVAVAAKVLLLTILFLEIATRTYFSVFEYIPSFGMCADLWTLRQLNVMDRFGLGVFLNIMQLLKNLSAVYAIRVLNPGALPKVCQRLLKKSRR